MKTLRKNLPRNKLILSGVILVSLILAGASGLLSPADDHGVETTEVNLGGEVLNRTETSTGRELIRNGIRLEKRESFKDGVVEDGLCHNENGDFENLDRIMHGHIQIPWHWGEGRLVSGDLVELDDGRILRRAILKINNKERLILSIESFDAHQKLLSQDYFDAESVSVRTQLRYLDPVLGFLRENCHREVVGTESIRQLNEGVILLNAPAHASGIFGFLNHVQELIGYPVKVELVEVDEWGRF